MDTSRNGHKPKWTQAEMDTSLNGHKPKWTQAEMDSDEGAHSDNGVHSDRTRSPALVGSRGVSAPGYSIRRRNSYFAQRHAQRRSDGQKSEGAKQIREQ